METRILLVEDNWSVAESVIAALEIRGHVVKWAITLNDARALMDNVDFDIAIVDLNLENELGVDLFPLPRSITACMYSGLPDDALRALKKAEVSGVTVFSKSEPASLMDWVAENQRAE